MKRTALILFAALLLQAGPVRAAEIHLSFAAMEKLLVQESFDRNGDLYLFGDETTPCLYASLSNPKIAAAGKSLSVRFFFSGRLAREIGDSCVGVGDEFHLTIQGRPAYQGGVLYLTDVRFTERNDGTTFDEYLQEFVDTTIQSIFRHDVGAEINGLIAASRGHIPYTVELTSFDIPRIAVGSDHLAITVDFSLFLR